MSAAIHLQLKMTALCTQQAIGNPSGTSTCRSSLPRPISWSPASCTSCCPLSGRRRSCWYVDAPPGASYFHLEPQLSCCIVPPCLLDLAWCIRAEWLQQAANQVHRDRLVPAAGLGHPRVHTGHSDCPLYPGRSCLNRVRSSPSMCSSSVVSTFFETRKSLVQYDHRPGSGNMLTGSITHDNDLPDC